MKIHTFTAHGEESGLQRLIVLFVNVFWHVQWYSGIFRDIPTYSALPGFQNSPSPPPPPPPSFKHVVSTMLEKAFGDVAVIEITVVLYYTIRRFYFGGKMKLIKNCYEVLSQPAEAWLRKPCKYGLWLQRGVWLLSAR